MDDQYSPLSAVDNACLQAFKEPILPQIERDVLTGVMESNRTAEFGIDRVEPDEHIQERYLRLFTDGLSNLHRNAAASTLLFQRRLAWHKQPDWR